MSAKVNFQFFDNPILCLSRELCSIFKMPIFHLSIILDKVEIAEETHLVFSIQFS